jgi:hypothetical protein
MSVTSAALAAAKTEGVESMPTAMATAAKYFFIRSPPHVIAMAVMPRARIVVAGEAPSAPANRPGSYSVSASRRNATPVAMPVVGTSFTTRRDATAHAVCVL